MSEPKQDDHHKEFKVEIDVSLPPDVIENIRRAIQRAVLTELANTDVAPGYSVALRDPDHRSDENLPDFGELDGIWIREERTGGLL